MMDTLIELQSSMAETGDIVHWTSVARLLPHSQLYGRAAQRKPLFETTHMTSGLVFFSRHVGDKVEEGALI